MPNQASDKAELRDRLLDAAEAVVRRKGVQCLTLEAVAKEAGASKGGLLYHFRSKSDLITAIVERLGQRIEEKQLQLSSGDGSPGSFVRAYLAARTEPKKQGQKLLSTALLAAAATDSEFLEPARKRANEWQRKLQTDGIDPVEATIVKLAVDGLVFGALLKMPVPEGKLRERVLAKLRAMAGES